MLFVVLRLRLPPRSTRTDTLLPVTTPFRSSYSYLLTLAVRAHEALGKPQIAAQLLDRASLPVRNDATVFAGAGAPVLLAGEAIAAPHSLSAVVPYVRALLEAGQTVEAVAHAQTLQIGRASCRGRVCQYGESSVV